MKRYLIVAVLLLSSSMTAADTPLSNMQLCSLMATTCSWLPLSTHPTISQKNTLHSAGHLFFTFKNGQTFTPPAGATWTLNLSLSWDGSSVSRSITYAGDGVTSYGVAFDMGIPDTTQFPPPPDRTMFTLQTTVTNQNGSPIDAATNTFYFRKSNTVSESSATSLWLVVGLVAACGLLKFLHPAKS